MKVVSSTINPDTDKDVVVLIFNDDNELNSFITKLAETDVKTSGVRILTMVPKGLNFTPLQKSLLGVIDGFDGVLGKNNEEIIDNSVETLENILEKYK